MLEGAGEGALDSAETGLLDWLAQAWNVKIEIATSLSREPGADLTQSRAGRKRG